MGLRGVAMVLFAGVCCAARPAYAQTTTPAAPSEQLTLTAKAAATWTEGSNNIVLLRGPLTIELDQAKLSADAAVIWLTPANADNLDLQNAQITLLGNARLQQSGITRSGDRLSVTAQVHGDKIRIVADERLARDESASELFQQARALRGADQPALQNTAIGPATTRATGPDRAVVAPKTRPAKAKAAEIPLYFEAQNVESVRTDDGFIAIVLHGGVHLIDRRPDNTYLEMSADNAVLFTTLRSMKELGQSGGKKNGREPIIAAFLEDDVRLDYVPFKKGAPEQRLSATRVYYELATDRAVLTDAIIHTTDPQRGTPLIMRAKLVRQLAQGEYTANQAQLTTSQFAVPSYSLASERLYVRDEPTGDPRLGDRIIYDAKNTTFEAFHIPFFYLPHTAGEMNERGLALRGVGFGNSNDFGAYGESLWGLFESLGQAPPRDLDANYRVDYFSKRGPALGFNAAYTGGFVTDTTKQPWDFEGEFRSYFVDDKGQDDLGPSRLRVRVDNPESIRGQVLWEHQHFFPDGWQAQARVGYVSDPTFLEQWFRRDFFEEGPPHDLMGYLKHQVDTEAFTIGVTYQPSNIVTNSIYQQEQFEVDRLPAIGYFREGDSIAADRATFFSENTVQGLHFSRSRDSLLDQGFVPVVVTPGVPAEGYTGLTGNIVWRGDFRQEADLPFTVGPLRVDPYVMARYTQYSSSPQDAQRARGLIGAGARVTTELWKVDPTVESSIFDLHQLRHVIEPEVNVFTSAMNTQRNQVFVYDQDVDAINDVSAVEFGLHQRWQTKRGGPGSWRSVDAFTLNVDVEYYNNKPGKGFNNPATFRGQYFSSYPEESTPRDAINADASWRLSDNTVLLADMSYNLDSSNLQTLSLGILVQRDTRLSYFVGNRYIALLNSNITSVHLDYEFTPKYLLDIDQEFDFTQGKNVYSSLALIRRFDTFFLALKYFFDETTNENGVSFNLYPMGLGQGLDSSAFSTFRR